MLQETQDVQDQCSLLAERTAKLSAAVYCQLSAGMSTLDERTATRHIESLLEYVYPSRTMLVRLLNSVQDSSGRGGNNEAAEEGPLHSHFLASRDDRRGSEDVKWST